MVQERRDNRRIWRPASQCRLLSWIASVIVLQRRPPIYLLFCRQNTQEHQHRPSDGCRKRRAAEEKDGRQEVILEPAKFPELPSNRRETGPWPSKPHGEGSGFFITDSTIVANNMVA
jgi:hypothetical protein